MAELVTLHTAQVWHRQEPAPTALRVSRVQVLSALDRIVPVTNAERRRTQWSTGIVAQWEGEGPREVEIATDTAGWDHTGKPPVAICWVLMRAPRERCKPQALLSTDLEHTPEQRLPWCARRWTMEVTCEAARTHRGMETQSQSAAHRNYLASLARGNMLFLQVILFRKPWSYFCNKALRNTACSGGARCQTTQTLGWSADRAA